MCVKVWDKLTIGKDQTILVGQAKDGNTFEDSEDILREDFPDKKREEDDVEDLQARFCYSLVLVKGLEKRCDRQVHRPEHVGRVHKDVAEQTSKTEPNQLGSDNDKDTSGLVRVTSVE